MIKLKTAKNFSIIFLIFISLTFVNPLFQGGCVAISYLTEKDNGSEVEISEGEIITIKLESNPSTGYSWNISGDFDNQIIEPVTDEFEEKNNSRLSRRVGASGYQIITFKALSEGKTNLTLTYNRPWEKDEEPVDTFHLKITVR